MESFPIWEVLMFGFYSNKRKIIPPPEMESFEEIPKGLNGYRLPGNTVGFQV